MSTASVDKHPKTPHCTLRSNHYELNPVSNNMAKKAAKKTIKKTAKKATKKATKKVAKKATKKTAKKAAKKVAKKAAKKTTKKVAKKQSAKKSTAKAKTNTVKAIPTYEEISQQAYLIYLDRVASNRPGDQQTDWEQALKMLSK